MRLKRGKFFEARLLLLREKAEHSSVTIQDILDIFSGKGKYLLLLLLSLPFAQPLQIPGLSTPFGCAIAFIGFRGVFGKSIWLPQRLRMHQVQGKTLKKITRSALWLLKKIDPWIYPRLGWACRSSFMRATNGVLIALLGILLALPLPIPFSNLATAWSIVFIALGCLKDDGLLILIGNLTSLIAGSLLAFLISQMQNYF